MRMHMNLDHVASGHFVLRRDVLCEFEYWPLAVSMPPTKVCSQCKAAAPVRQIVSCPVYFLHAVILSFEKQSGICEKKTMKHKGAVEPDSIKSARKAKDKGLWKSVRNSRVNFAWVGTKQCAWQAWESHETVIDNTQLQLHALLRWGFGTSVPFIVLFPGMKDIQSNLQDIRTAHQGRGHKFPKIRPFEQMLFNPQILA